MPKKAVLVGIGGASSSGKTSVAKLLHKIIPDSILLHQDDFYKNDKDIPTDPATGEADWDCPGAINFDDFEKELQYIRANASLSPETESYENRYNSDTKDSGSVSIPQNELDEFESKISKLLAEKNFELILVDGFMLFHDPKIIKLFDIRIFLRASYQTLKHRRENRAGYQTQETFWVDPPGYFDKLVYPGYSKSHKHLFEDENVENKLNPTIVQELNIVSFANNEGCTLKEVLLWSLNSLINELQNI